MNINYEYYRIFYYVAKYNNLTQAAEAMPKREICFIERKNNNLSIAAKAFKTLLLEKFNASS